MENPKRYRLLEISGFILKCQKLGCGYDDYTELKVKYLSGYGPNASCANMVIMFYNIMKYLHYLDNYQLLYKGPEACSRFVNYLQLCVSEN